MLPNDIFSTITNLLSTAWNAVYSWFNTMLNSTHSKNYIIGIILAMFLVRFIIYPFLKRGIVGAGSSDSVYDRSSIYSGVSDSVRNDTGTPVVDKKMYDIYVKAGGHPFPHKDSD